MLSPIVPPPGLITGEKLTLDEFLSRWECLPDIKNAELIDGVVYVPSPVNYQHTHFDFRVHSWLGYYAESTPGCEGGCNGTWLMLGNAPQPDGYLRSLPSHGGQSGNERGMTAGAPELAVEISFSSTSIDFGPKLRLYLRAGVQEYITVECFPQRLTWRVLDGGVYVTQEVPADGILRSRVFPGLWLDVEAFWSGGPGIFATLNAGLASEEHQKFVARLAAAQPK